MTHLSRQLLPSGWPALRPVRLLSAAGPLSLALLLGVTGCATKSPQISPPVSAGQVPPEGASEAKNQSDLTALTALTPAQRGAYLQQHPDIVHRIYAGHDQQVKVQFAKLMQQR